jgi:acetyl-CoA synthetase
MSEKLHKVPEDFAALAHLRNADYQRLYQESVRDPQSFWSRIGRRLDWIHPYSKVKDTSFEEADSPLDQAWRQDSDPVGRRRSTALRTHHLSPAV